MYVPGDARRPLYSKNSLSENDSLPSEILSKFQDEGFAYVATVQLLKANSPLSSADERKTASDSGRNKMKTNSDTPAALKSPLWSHRLPSGSGASLSPNGFIRVTRSGHMYRSPTAPPLPTSGVADAEVRAGIFSSMDHTEVRLPRTEPAATTLTSPLSAPSSGTDGIRQQSSSSERGRRTLGVYGEDQRASCPLPTGLPYSAIGQMDIRDSTGARFICTGTLIGPDVVLTAAHCVFSRAHGRFYGDLDFAPGRYRTAAASVTDQQDAAMGSANTVNPYGVIAWDHVSIYDNYATPGASDPHVWDVAVIHLNQSVGRLTGWMGVKAPCQEPLPAAFDLGTAGYPLKKPFGTCMSAHCRVTQASMAK